MKEKIYAEIRYKYDPDNPDNEKFVATAYLFVPKKENSFFILEKYRNREVSVFEDKLYRDWGIESPDRKGFRYNYKTLRAETPERIKQAAREYIRNELSVLKTVYISNTIAESAVPESEEFEITVPDFALPEPEQE